MAKLIRPLAVTTTELIPSSRPCLLHQDVAYLAPIPPDDSRDTIYPQRR